MLLHWPVLKDSIVIKMRSSASLRSAPGADDKDPHILMGLGWWGLVVFEPCFLRHDQDMRSIFEFLRGNKNKHDFPPFLNIFIHQSLDLYTSKTKHFRKKSIWIKAALNNFFYTSKTDFFKRVRLTVEIIRIFLLGSIKLVACEEYDFKIIASCRTTVQVSRVRVHSEALDLVI